MTKTKVKKSVLKEKNSYYYETIPIFDSLPDTLKVPEYKTEIFTETISHGEILEKYNIKPYTVEQAAAVIADVIPTLQNDYKSRIAYFEKDNTLYRLSAWRDDDGQLDLSVNKVHRDDGYDAGDGACFSNGDLDALNPESLTLKSSDTYTELVEWLYLNTGSQLSDEMKGKLLTKLKEVFHGNKNLS